MMWSMLVHSVPFAMELLHQLDVSLGDGQIVVMNKRTIDADGIDIFLIHVLLKTRDNLL